MEDVAIIGVGLHPFGRFEKTAFEHVALHGRAIADFFTSMVCDGATSRTPNLRIVS